MAKPLDPQARERLAQAIFGAPPRPTLPPPTPATHEHYLMAYTDYTGGGGTAIFTPTGSLPGSGMDATYKHGVDLADIEYLASGLWQEAQA